MSAAGCTWWTLWGARIDSPKCRHNCAGRVASQSAGSRCGSRVGVCKDCWPLIAEHLSSGDADWIVGVSGLTLKPETAPKCDCTERVKAAGDSKRVGVCGRECVLKWFGPYQPSKPAEPEVVAEAWGVWVGIDGVEGAHPPTSTVIGTLDDAFAESRRLSQEQGTSLVLVEKLLNRIVMGGKKS